MTNKETQRKPISYYLEDDTRLSEITVSAIKKWMEDAPFDQTIKLLHAKKLKSENRLSDHMLQLVSTYATDRANLYDHLHLTQKETKPDSTPKEVPISKETPIKSDKIQREIVEDIQEIDTEKSKNEAPIVKYETESKIRYALPVKPSKKKKKKLKKKEKMVEKVDKLNKPDKKKPKIKLKKKKNKEKEGKKKTKTLTEAKTIPILKKTKTTPNTDKKKKKKAKKKKVSYVYVRSEGNMSSPFELNDYTGISRYSNWLLSMKEDIKEKKKSKDKRKQKKKKSEKGLHTVKINEMVISESLADLLLKQGHKNKARKMYKKLSLIFPEKSTYFAAKIETLKK